MRQRLLVAAEKRRDRRRQGDEQRTVTAATTDLKITPELRCACSSLTTDFLSPFSENRAGLQSRGAARGEPFDAAITTRPSSRAMLA